MGTARTSPKVVRERRAKGIRSNRGKVRRHFPRAQRNDRHLEAVARDAKAWEPGSDPLQEAADRIVALAHLPESLRADVTQEVWVQLLEGQSEEAITESLAAVVKQTKEIEMGGRHISLDTPMSPTGDGALTLGDFVDTDGKYHRTKPRAYAKKPMARCECGRPRGRDAMRCMECVRADHADIAALRDEVVGAKRELQQAKREALRAALEAEREAVRQELMEWKEEYLAGRSARYRGEPLAQAKSSDTTQNRTGIPHRLDTKVAMSLARTAAWEGEYGEKRRAALNVEQRICRKCGYDGPRQEFSKNPNSYGGVDKICKPCMNKQVQEMKQRRKAQAA